MTPKEDSAAKRRGLPATIFTAVSVTAVCFAFSASVHAQSIDAAKAAGHVVEQADGLLATCPGAPASVSGTVEAINAKRLKQYQDIAASTGATLAQVKTRAGAKLRQASPGGCK